MYNTTNLKITDQGKYTLNAFEPIAFNQTKEALLTLTNEEIDAVHRGVALYAKGLKNSRFKHQVEAEQLRSEPSVNSS